MPQTLPILSPSHPVTVPLIPLSPPSFAPFGTCVTPPLPPGLNEAPSSPPSARHPAHQPSPMLANQNTALKSSPISPLIDNYPGNHPPSRPLMSMFSCFPRPTSQVSSGKLPITILERHPYTTQTFSPLALSTTDSSTCFLVVVAPSLPTATVNAVAKPPDLANLKAFVARGDQAVTYAPGTWHAPMIVLGKTRLDFVVTQFANGVAGDDCQEVNVNGLDVSLDGLPIRSVL
ncbi:hypothetical protein DV737_g4109, partial [Chaetothyriales sp. CBS 132003]